MIRRAMQPPQGFSGAIAAEIACLYACYAPLENTAVFYEQIDKQGVCAYASWFAGQICLVRNGGDAQELTEWLRFMPKSPIFCEEKTAYDLSLTGQADRHLMRCEVPLDVPVPQERPTFLSPDAPRKAVRLLKTGLCVISEDDFVADLTYRLYHGGARLTLSETGACILLIGSNGCVLSALAVAPTHQHCGEGSRLLRQSLTLVPGQTVYTCCEEKLRAFYEMNGFCVIGKAGLFGVKH